MATSKRASGDRALIVSIVSLMVSVLLAVPAAFLAGSQLFGLSLPWQVSQYHEAEESFVRAYLAHGAVKVRQAIDYTSPESDAERYVILHYKAWLARDLTGPASVPVPPKLTFLGDTLRGCVGKRCFNLTQFQLDSHGRIGSFSLDGVPLRELIVKPGPNSTVPYGAISVTFVGQYESLLHFTVDVMKVTSLAGNSDIALDKMQSIDGDYKYHALSGNGRQHLNQAQSTWVGVTSSSSDVQEIFLPLTNDTQAATPIWVPIYS